MHLVGFIIRIYHDARLPERQTWRGVDVELHSFLPSALYGGEERLKIELYNNLLFQVFMDVKHDFTSQGKNIN